VTKVDPGRGSVLGTIEVTEACGVAADGSSLWIVSPALGEMLRFDPETLEQKASIQLGKMSFLVATGAEGVWAAGETYGGTVWRVDPASNSVVAELAVPQPFVTGLELGFGSAWVASRELATIYRIDPATNTVGKTLKMPSYIGGIGVGSDSIWISGWGDGMVHRLDPATNEIVASVNTGYGNLGPPLEAIGSLWVAALDRNEVLRLDLAAFDD
jgi:streptogramin lyase